MECIVPFGQVSKEAVIPICLPRSEFAVTLAVSRPEDACVEPRSRSEFYHEAFQKITHFVTILSMRYFSNFRTFTVFSLAVEMPSLLLTVNLPSTDPLLLAIKFCCPLPTASPMITSWSKSSDWLRRFLFCCVFFRVETILILTSELHF